MTTLHNAESGYVCRIVYVQYDVVRLFLTVPFMRAFEVKVTLYNRKSSYGRNIVGLQ